MYLMLHLVTGENLEFQIEGNSCVIGRSNKCDIVIPHEGMSRQHCQIDIIDGNIFVTDLGSTNGVLINGEKIEPSKKTPYQTYLSLSFGAVKDATIDVETRKLSGSNGFDQLKAAPNSASSNNETRVMSSKTKTVKLEVEEEKKKGVSDKAGPKSKKEDDPNQKRMLMSVILAILMLASAVYYYMDQEPPAEDTGWSDVPSEPIPGSN